MTYLDCSEGVCNHPSHQRESLAQLEAVLTHIAAADRRPLAQGSSVSSVLRREDGRPEGKVANPKFSSENRRQRGVK